MSENKSKTISSQRSALKTVDIVYIGIFAALMAVCSWISIPAPAPLVPFTLQTFGVFLAVCLLGGFKGTLAVLIYILLGALGLPVFAGFKGGVGILFGSTGGYIIGFLFSALTMWFCEHLLGKKLWSYAVSMLLALLVCYAFGTAWFMIVYSRTSGPASLLTVLGWCVFPFIIPDLLKIALALFIGTNKAVRTYSLPSQQ